MNIPLKFQTIALYLFMVIVVFTCSITPAHATMGGDDSFEMLGYDAHEHKVFFEIINGDESSNPNAVYYFNLNQPSSAQYAQYANSLYQLNQYHECLYECTDLLNQKLNQIKHRLTPLIPTKTDFIRLQIFEQTDKTIPWYNDPELPTPLHHIRYRVLFDNGRITLSGLGEATYYNDDFKMDAAFKIPNRPEMIVVTKFLGKPFELGYQKFNVILLTP